LDLIYQMACSTFFQYPEFPANISCSLTTILKIMTLSGKAHNYSSSV